MLLPSYHLLLHESVGPLSHQSLQPISLEPRFPFLHSSPDRQSDPHPKVDDAFRYMLQRIAKPSDYSTSGDMIFSGHTRLVIMSITVGYRTCHS